MVTCDFVLLIDLSLHQQENYDYDCFGVTTTTKPSRF